MAEPRRVLYVDHTGELGGAERVLLELFERLDRSRVMPYLAASPDGPLLELAAQAHVVTRPLSLDEAARTLAREAWGRNPLAFAWRARGYCEEAAALATMIRRCRIDFVHTNTLKAHVLGSLAALLAGRPVVWYMHDMPSTRGDTRVLLDQLARLARPHIVAVSQAVANDLTPRMQARCRVVHNGIDLAAFDARRGVPSPPLRLPPGDGPLIGSMSHLIPWKGHEVFLRAAAQMREVRPELRFAIIGDPIFQWRDERVRLESIAAELGLTDNVSFVGHRDDVPAVLAVLDLFVLPSLFEPFGRVLLEAMAASRPIVASGSGGVPEIVADGETGLLVPPGDPHALAAACLRLMADAALRRRFGGAGRERVARYFSLDAQVGGLLAAYEGFGLLPAVTLTRQ